MNHTHTHTHTQILCVDSLWSSLEGSVGVSRISPVFITHVISHSSKPHSKPQCQQTLIIQQQLAKEYGHCCQSEKNLTINHGRQPASQQTSNLPTNITHSVCDESQIRIITWKLKLFNYLSKSLWKGKREFFFETHYTC